MDNVGRGYSFEALKKRLLMTHGAHKREEPPKFAKSSPRDVPMMGFMVAEPAASTPVATWLGCDISTLAASPATEPEN